MNLILVHTRLGWSWVARHTLEMRVMGPFYYLNWVFMYISISRSFGVYQCLPNFSLPETSSPHCDWTLSKLTESRFQRNLRNCDMRSLRSPKACPRYVARGLYI